MTQWAFLTVCVAMCLGGPLVYDGVQLVHNSAALNGTQRVLLDDVISMDECSELKNLAHVRPSFSCSLSIFVAVFFGCHRYVCLSIFFDSSRLSPWQEMAIEAKCLLTHPMRGLRGQQYLKPYK